MVRFSVRVDILREVTYFYEGKHEKTWLIQGTWNSLTFLNCVGDVVDQTCLINISFYYLGSRARLGRPSVTWECERVTRVPSHVQRGYRLSTFYQKYLHAFGIPVISSNRVQNDALKRACYVVVFLFADRQDIRSWFYKRYGRAGVIAYSEGVTSIPEHSWLGSWWNQRARGLGATIRHPISTGKNMLS